LKNKRLIRDFKIEKKMSTKFTLHDLDSAPEGSKPLLEKFISNFGRIIGFYGMLAESPEALRGYKALSDAFDNTTLSDDEKTVVWQTINVEHECHYCVPAHTFMAKAMKVSDELNDALRDETPLPDARLEALRDFTLILVRNRGHASDAEIEAFLDAGYTRRNILEVVLGISEKVLSNYVNHLTKTPVDKEWDRFAWSRSTRS
jgi:alkylhydroperoxidase family enzyme